jgi:hypothetical protein
MTSQLIKKWVILPLFIAAVAWFAWMMLLGQPDLSRRASWQAMASPGRLSSAHAFLATNCVACHTPNKGVEAQNCIVCHANDLHVLQREPTAFHADVRSCVECHVEHQGLGIRPTTMDHAMLAKLGLHSLANGKTDTTRTRIISWISDHAGNAGLPPGHPTNSPEEAALNCIVCHASEDRHRGLFGTDCIQCHTTIAWTVPEFRHPAPTSTSCVQCHQAPPSHYMMHFQMISMTVAGQMHAKVDECFLCHQTNDWNDIKGVGWYKHH